MLATALPIPIGSEWAYEVKWDGMRMLCGRAADGGRVDLRSRSGADVTAAFPEIADAAAALPPGVLLDGELVAFDTAGRPSFPALGSRLGVRGAAAGQLAVRAPLTYVVFDLLRHGGADLTSRPYQDRREVLAEVERACRGSATAQRLVVPGFFDDGQALLAATAEQGLEGVVAKRRTSTYQPGVRSRDWIKHAHRATQQVVVIGWRSGPGSSGQQVASLAIAVAEQADRWRFAGTVGSGLGSLEAEALGAVLPQVVRAEPVVELGVDDRRALQRSGFTWVEPVVVADVGHLGTLESGRLRQPVVVRLRPDLTPDDLRPDGAADTTDPTTPPDALGSGSEPS